MISGPRVTIDYVTRLATAPAAIHAPVGGDLFLFLGFTGQSDTGSAVALSPSLSALSLVMKEFITGEAVVRSDGYELVAGSSPSQWIIHVPMTGPALSAAIDDNGAANLLAEIQWVIPNPFAANIGPAAITTRSQTFPVAYTTRY